VKEEKKENSSGKQSKKARKALWDKLNINPRRHIPSRKPINYGVGAENLVDHGDETFYLTTAINYTNGFPHIGHAYEVGRQPIQLF